MKEKYFSINGSINGVSLFLRIWLQGTLIVFFGLGIFLQVISITQRINAFRGKNKKWENLIIALFIQLSNTIAGGLGGFAANSLGRLGDDEWITFLPLGIMFLFPYFYILFFNANKHSVPQKINSDNDIVFSKEKSKSRNDLEENDSCKCGSKIKDDAKFCSECGEEVIRKPKIQLCDCGQEINPNAKFCNNCGLKTSVQPTQNVTEKEVSKVQVDDSNSSFKIDSSDEEKNINEGYEMGCAGIITLIIIIFIIYVAVTVK